MSPQARRRFHVLILAVLPCLLLGAALLLWRPHDPSVLPGPAQKEPDQEEPVEAPLPPVFEDVTASSGIRFTYRNGEEADLYTPLEALGGGVALFDYDGDGLLDIFVTGGGYFDGPDKKQVKGHPCKLYKNLGNWKFKDVTNEVGLDQIPFYTHGCAVADYDRDGWPDLLVTGYRGVALFHNEPVDPKDPGKGRRFRDVTGASGLVESHWATSAAWADLDGDGYPDLYICKYSDWSIEKYRKIGFFPLLGPSWSSRGRLDYVATIMAGTPQASFPGAVPWLLVHQIVHMAQDIPLPRHLRGVPHALYRNNRNGTFTELSFQAGLNVRGGTASTEFGRGLGVLIADVNGDGRPDIFVANDSVDKFLYLYTGKGMFTEMGRRAMVALNDFGSSTSSRGVDIGDYNRSGRASIFVTNGESETHDLYHNRGTADQPFFQSHTHSARIDRLGQHYGGWGTGFLDLDHDGWEDLFIANGHALRFPRPARLQKPVLLRNEGGKFKDISRSGGPYFQQTHLARGAALGDLNNDGKVDLAISHINEPITVLRNIAPEGNHWLGVELIGKENRDVVGGRIIVETGGHKLTRFAKGGGSYLSSSDPRHVFGLGKNTKIERVMVLWPWGEAQEWEGSQFTADRYWRLVEGEKLPQAWSGRGTAQKR
jgi:hypothetical protein